MYKPKNTIKNHTVSKGLELWVMYDITIGQSQYGEYEYIQTYANDCIEVLFTDEKNEIDLNTRYIKGTVRDIIWHYDGVQFIINVGGHNVYIKDPDRLFISL